MLGTAGLSALVYGVIRTEAAGWGSAEVLGLLGAAAALLAAFVYAESRAADPLVPLRLFRVRGLSVSALALALNGGAFLGMFFMTALYLQQVHGDSALEAGAHFVPMGIAAIASAVVGAQLVTRVGTRAAYLAGSAVGVVGLLLLSRAGADADYVTGILPGIVVFALGLPLVGVANQIAAIAEVPHERRGRRVGHRHRGVSDRRRDRPRARLHRGHDTRRATPSPRAPRSPRRWPRVRARAAGGRRTRGREPRRGRRPGAADQARRRARRRGDRRVA